MLSRSISISSRRLKTINNRVVSNSRRSIDNRIWWVRWKVYRRNVMRRLGRWRRIMNYWIGMSRKWRRSSNSISNRSRIVISSSNRLKDTSWILSSCSKILSLISSKLNAVNSNVRNRDSVEYNSSKSMNSR